jgi:Tol biopolymer transport system component
MVFYRTPKGTHDNDYTKTSLWAADIDGSNLHKIIGNGDYGWLYQGHAEWSPDGKNLVMFGKLGQLYITDSDGQGPKLLSISGQNNGLSDPSYSPSGASILYAYKQHIWKVSNSGGTPVQLTNDSHDDYDPYYSPDGTQIALLTHTSTNIQSDWAIRIVKSDGSNLKFFINDGNINSKPAWSLDGSKIYFHRHPNGAGSGFFGLWVQNLNGTGLAAIDAGDGSNEYPAVLFTSTAAQQNATTNSDNNSSSPSGSNNSTSTPTASNTAPESSKKFATSENASQKASQTPEPTANKTKNKNGLLNLAIGADIILITWFGFRLWKKHKNI